MAPRQSKARKRKLQSLSRGRPPTIQKPASSLSSKQTRTVIRTYHQLQKAHAQALACGNAVLAASIATQIEAKGGLKRYQEASQIGQSKQRGGDSSRVLMEWLKDMLSDELSAGLKKNQHRLKLLEVGALTTRNACAKANLFEVTRIDLHSQEKEIQQQDFMERRLPTSVDEKFDIISLSLVLNYVPDPEGRGQMLRRTTEFLSQNKDNEGLERVFPCMFLVLPAPCVHGSRYLTEAHLTEMMTTLGYRMLRKKISAKLVYYLWKFHSYPQSGLERTFHKEEINPGKKRNNFAIVLR